jgi:DNA polymerase III epsilon subunit-like protein
MFQAESGPQGLADYHADAWLRFAGREEPPPTWFRDAAETLELLHQHLVIPDDYLVFDCETCGFDAKVDLILEVGWGVVRDRQLVDCQGLVLDWTLDPRIDKGWLRWAIERTRKGMADKGRPYHFSYERLSREGVPPWEGLHAIVRLLYDSVTTGVKLVGHNAWRFDRRMIDGHTARFMNGYQLPWHEFNLILDTGLIEKAIQTNRPIYEHEDLDEWFDRIERAKISGVSWNLDQWCVPKYRIVERHGLDMCQAHTAGFDCRCTYHLLETYRALIAALCGQNGGAP